MVTVIHDLDRDAAQRNTNYDILKTYPKTREC
jgi:hypothetical protein